jgi:soluble P-type ATPase
VITVAIPDFGRLQLDHLVLDYNGTLARDGKLLPAVPRLLRSLAKKIRIHVVTADTFGMAVGQLKGLPVTLKILPPDRQSEAKRSFVVLLGTRTVVAVGNGRNDRKMLKAAALGIAVVQGEGAAVQAMAAADIVATNIQDALGLLTQTKRSIATLRS